MKLKYVTTRSTERPAEIDETSSKTTVYLRKNIHEVTVPATEEGVADSTVFEYEEAQLTRGQYATYKAMDEAATERDMAIIEIAEAYEERFQDLETKMDEGIVALAEMMVG